MGGEAIDTAAVRRCIAAQVAPAGRLVNMYGITETTVHATFAPLDQSAQAVGGATPIGRPLPHVTIRLVDEALQAVPPGQTGEILVGGPSVAFGYWRRSELTADRFVTVDGERYYRSGDRGFIDEQGSLRYVGRTDDQVKVRGHRVELAEVEAALCEHPSVGAAACAVEPGPAGHGILVATVVTEPASRDVSPKVLRDALRRHLQTCLPDHEIPTRYRFTAQLPITDSGKVDRRRLISPA